MKKQILMFIVAVCIFSITPIELFSADQNSSDGGTSDSQQSSSGQKPGGGPGGSSESSGSIKTGDKTGTIESYVLATEGAHRVAEKIEKSVFEILQTIQTVIILDDAMRAQLNALVAYRVNFRVKCIVLTTKYDNVLEELTLLRLSQSSELQDCIKKSEKERLAITSASTPIAPIDVGSILQSLVQLTKTDVAVNGVDVTLPDEIIIDEVTSMLLRLKKVVIRPSLYFAAVMQNGDDVKKAIDKLLSYPYELRNQAEVALRELVENLGKAKGCSSPSDRLKEEIRDLQKKIDAKKEELKKLNTEFDNFMISLISNSLSGDDGEHEGQKQPSTIVNNIYLGSSTDGNTSGKKPSDKKSQAGPQQKPSLADLVMAQLLLDKYNEKNVALLTLQIQQGGGGYLAKNNLWTFFGKWPLQHSGGIVVTFSFIFPVDGSILASGAVPYYRGFIKSRGFLKFGNVEDVVDKKMENESKKKGKGGDTATPSGSGDTATPQPKTGENK